MGDKRHALPLIFFFQNFFLHEFREVGTSRFFLPYSLYLHLQLHILVPVRRRLTSGLDIIEHLLVGAEPHEWMIRGKHCTL